jgi:hypothetical protein
MSAVLVTVMNGAKVVDSGTGIVLCQDPTGETTYVLTCAHTLRAMGGRVADAQQNPMRIVVKGKDAKDIGDALLARLDLAVLTVPGYVDASACLRSSAFLRGAVSCVGYTPFFQQQYEHREVLGTIRNRVRTVMPDGEELHYFEVEPAAKSEKFEKGLSGAPVYDSEKSLIGVARMRVGEKEAAPRAYAIELTDKVIERLQEVVPSALVRAPGTTLASPTELRPPPAPPPLPESVEADDLQKNRWGGKSDDGEFRLGIANLKEYRRYFSFDAVLETTGRGTLVGPVLFHLHDTYSKSVIWIRKISNGKAVLEEIEASGTFTIGVQFLTSTGWRTLEFDLADFGDLKRYDVPRSGARTEAPP